MDKELFEIAPGLVVSKEEAFKEREAMQKKLEEEKYENKIEN